MDICVLFTVVNSAVMNMHVYVFALQFGGGGSLSRSGIAWSNASSMFKFLTNSQTAFYSSWTILYSHQQLQSFQCLHISTSTYYFLFFVFFFYHPSGYEVVLICNFLMAHIQHLLLCFLTICMSFMRECLCKFFAQFLIGLSVFLLLSCNVLYIFWILDSDMWFANVFHSACCLFISLIMSFDALIFKILLSPIYLFFSPVANVFDVISKNPLPNTRWWRFTLLFPSEFYSFSSYI